MEDGLNRLLTLVPWSLQRLLREEYEVTCDANGVPQALEMDPDGGVPSTETMEKALKASPLWDGLEKLAALRGHLTPERMDRDAIRAHNQPTGSRRDHSGGTRRSSAANDSALTVLCFVLRAGKQS